MMSTSFLSLLKEEPAEVTDMDSNNGRLAIPRPIGHQSSVVNDPQIQGLPISPLASSTMQPPGMIRSDIDPNFEPVPRGRSNTWPLLPEGFMESEEPSGVDPTTSGETQRVQGGSSLVESSGGPPKKNTSRRNPWGNMSYADLIAQAIASSPEGRATLSQIYDWMVQNVPYFKDKGDSNSSAGWKNSIRHNLSLHNRFMRMQNEGTGKSSWWVLNPDAKPGKSTRRRANTLEGSRLEKKRGRVRKKVDGLRNSIEAPSSPNLGEGIEYFPGSPTAGTLHHPFQLSPQDYRPRASSNASSCGRLSPIPAIESDMHDSQVPPMSPGVVWSPDYWSANNHVHSSHQSHMGRHVHEPYTDHLVESIGEGLKIGPREPWGPHHGLGPHSTPPDCLKIPHPHHPMNGFVPQSHNQHPPGYGSYDDYSSYVSSNSQCGTFSHSQPPPPPKDKHSIRRPHLLPFQIPPLQPLPSTHNSHNVSPTNAIGESHFSSPSCEQDMRSTPSFSSPPPHNNTPPNSHHTPPSTQQQQQQQHQHHHTSSSNRQEPCIETTKTTTTAGSSISTSNPHPQHQVSESTTMLRVALSHREASSCSINGVPHYKQNGVGQLHPLHSGSGANDLVDLDTIQGGLECNVEEVIKHELQYEDHLNFDFQQHGQASSYGHPHSYPHREGSGSQIGGSAGPVQVYSCSSIPSGNHWVR